MNLPRHPPVRQRGMTLVELMVAIALGMLIVAAMAILFANNSRGLAETERSGQKIENGRYALELLAGDLHHAGYFSVFDPRQVPLPAAMPDACATDAASLKAALALHVQGVDEATTTSLACLPDIKPGTDIIVTRRASTCVNGSAGCTALGANAPAFQASSCSAVAELGSGDVSKYFKLDTSTANLTLTRRDCATVAEIRRYLVRIYYVANNDVAGDGIPTLKRAELGAGAFSTTSLVQGVEQLQVEWGMDTTGDGNADVYGASPGTYLGCSPGGSPSCQDQWASVVSAKVHVLARNLTPTPGHADKKVYVLGRVADAATGAGDPRQVGPFNDGFKRTVFQEVVRLQNPSGRRLTP
jgi:type IV pilus assembly protein PilW